MRKLTILMALLLIAGGAIAQTEMTGFVDAAYTWNPADAAGEFGLDQVELDIFHQASDKTMLRTDLEWVKDGEDMVAQVEQGYMVYTADCGGSFTFGKFNAPIGFELLDAPDMYQYSHALVFDYGLPTNLTGAMLDYGFDSGLSVVGYIVNGWDANTSAGKTNTFGGRLGYESGEFFCGLSGITGKQDVEGEADTQELTRTVIDVDLGYARDAWTFGGEFNMGTATVAMPGEDMESEWMGLLAMSHYDFNDRVGLTVRYDWFDDADGWAFGMVGTEYQVRQAIAIAPTFAIADNCGALIEVRVDMSDQDAFVDADGDPTGSDLNVAFEMTYSW